jgi:hypothetical protein
MPALSVQYSKAGIKVFQYFFAYFFKFFSQATICRNATGNANIFYPGFNGSLFEFVE